MLWMVSWSSDYSFYVDVDNSHVSSGSVPGGGIKKEISQDIIFLPAEE